MALPSTGAQPIEEYIPGINTNGLYTNSVGNLLGSSNTINNPIFTGTKNGGVSNVLDLTSATTLTASQGGSVVLFDSTTGFQVKLPTPTVGLTYEFVVVKRPTSGSIGISTNSASVFLGGALIASIANGTSATFVADGSSNVVIGMNGTTTGGTIGTVFKAVATSATVWTISGQSVGSGALATPIV